MEETIRKILKYVTLLVAERPDVDFEQVDDDNILEKVHFVKHVPVEASSTMVRSLISAGKKAENLLPPKVYKYIMDNNLYQ
ncbi:MAG: hypothetical protein U5K71_07215 [Gracilimonas sp.]|nr:hypothetical protein [Gracilimonas sp.]